MKRQAADPRAFTLIELVVVIAVLGLLAMTLIPAMANTRRNASRLQCVDNLKQVGVAFRTWAGNNRDLYPMYVPNTLGGPPHRFTGAPFTTADPSSPGPPPGSAPVATYMYEVYMVMSNELVTTKILVCPTDERVAATNFVQFRIASQNSQAANNYVSYFIGKYADAASPTRFLCGDRNIWGYEGAGVPNLVTYPYGNSPSVHNNGAVVRLGTNSIPYCLFTDKMHTRAGNIALADGSVQQYSSDRLLQQLPRTGDPMNVIWFP